MKRLYGAELERIRDEASKEISKASGHMHNCTCRPCLTAFVAIMRKRRAQPPQENK